MGEEDLIYERRQEMTNQEAIKYLKQLYPNGGCCWLDEQRIEAIGMAVAALEREELINKIANYEKEQPKITARDKGWTHDMVVDKYGV